jgi:broad specificity phosphatase PhoE
MVRYLPPRVTCWCLLVGGALCTFLCGTTHAQAQDEAAQCPAPLSLASELHAVPPWTVPHTAAGNDGGRGSRRIALVWVVRHGEAEHNVATEGWRIRDPVLTARGWSQCVAAGKLLPPSHTFDLVVTSPLRRCVQTATALLRASGGGGGGGLNTPLRLVAHPDLQEVYLGPADTGRDAIELQHEFDTASWAKSPGRQQPYELDTFWLQPSDEAAGAGAGAAVTEAKEEERERPGQPQQPPYLPPERGGWPWPWPWYETKARLPAEHSVASTAGRARFARAQANRMLEWLLLRVVHTMGAPPPRRRSAVAERGGDGGEGLEHIMISAATAAAAAAVADNDDVCADGTNDGTNGTAAAGAVGVASGGHRQDHRIQDHRQDHRVWRVLLVGHQGALSALLPTAAARGERLLNGEVVEMQLVDDDGGGVGGVGAGSRRGGTCFWELQP